MKIRNRIRLIFSIVFLVLLGATFLSVFFISSNYRKQEFFERLKEQSHLTLKLLTEVKDIDEDILQTIDKNTINNLYDEKIVLFDSTGKNIYTSIDDTPIHYSDAIINRLKNEDHSIEITEGTYEVYAEKIHKNGAIYFSIAKANDKYGLQKIEYLGWTLLLIYLIAVAIIIYITFYFSKLVTDPINKLAGEIEKISSANLKEVVTVPATEDEIAFLADKFNELLLRIDRSFAFQKYFIQHVSHELKTPMAVLIANIERVSNEQMSDNLRQGLDFQKNGLMQLASVINTLLDISRFEENAGRISMTSLRVDELIFETMNELAILEEETHFDFNIQSEIEDAAELVVTGNERMLKLAFNNILKNASAYSEDKKVIINLNLKGKKIIVDILNNGKILSSGEQEMLYQYFFRGENSRQVKGFGLGLVLTQKIIQIHKGELQYTVNKEGMNCFSISLESE
jgi:signal transduction histidine kinase